MTPSGPKIRRSASVALVPMPAAWRARASASRRKVRLAASSLRNVSGETSTRKLWLPMAESGP